MTVQRAAVCREKRADPIDRRRRGPTPPLRFQKTAQTNVNEKRVHGSFGSQSLSFLDPCHPHPSVLRPRLTVGI